MHKNQNMWLEQIQISNLLPCIVWSAPIFVQVFQEFFVSEHGYLSAQFFRYTQQTSKMQD